MSSESPNPNTNLLEKEDTKTTHNDIAIRISNLGKAYQLYENPQDRLKQSLFPRIQRLMGIQTRQYYREFWALKDLSLEIKKGQTVGIIGRNGSGKSTLLQMICGTLTPTTGSIETKGRIAALLELGSGFNPEFSGRENVYMNAAVLGLSKKETDERFEDIAAFADIGDFIDQSVKTYSSGMVVRLAFAVIAHVDADILVVDEALSVGDAVFTQKCMRFIRAFQKQGTLLFVSHDMGAVQNLCKTAIWLADGTAIKVGPSRTVAEAYLQYTMQEVYGDEQHLTKVSSNGETFDEEQTQSTAVIEYETKASVQDNLSSATGWKTGAAELLGLRLKHLSPGQDNFYKGGEKVRMVIKAVAHQDLFSPIIGFIVKDRLGQDLFGENTLPYTATKPKPVKAGQRLNAEFDFRLPMLPDGQYVVMASIADGDFHNHTQHHYLHDAYIINISSSKVRWGLLGLLFERISLEIDNGQ